MLELKLMNQDKGEIERILGMKIEKKGTTKNDTTTKTGPSFLSGTRKLGSNPVGPAAPA